MRSLALAVAASMAACTGTAGPAGTAGAAGTSGLVVVSDVAAGAACASGGQRIRAGQDANANGTLDESEVAHDAVVCGSDGGRSLSSLACTENQIARFDGADWQCASLPADADSFAALSCPDGSAPRRTAAGWDCAVFAPAGQSCAEGFVKGINAAGAVVCSSASSAGDTLGSLACAEGQFPVRSNGAWTCGEPSRRAIVVSAAGTAEESGQRLIEALHAITDASAARPYVLRLGPGVFDLGHTRLVMKHWVGIEGAGRLATSIVARGSANDAMSFAVAAADSTELRSLRIVNAGGTAYATGLLVSGATRFAFSDAEIEVSGASTAATGLLADGAGLEVRNVQIKVSSNPGASEVHGVLAQTTAQPTGALRLDGVRVQVAGGGRVNGIRTATVSAALVARNVDVRVSGDGVMASGLLAAGTVDLVASDFEVLVKAGAGMGVVLSGASAAAGIRVTVDNLQSAYSTEALYAESAGPLVTVRDSLLVAKNAPTNRAVTAIHGAAVKLAGTQMIGAAYTSNGGTLKCLNSYDENLDPRASDCR